MVAAQSTAQRRSAATPAALIPAVAYLRASSEKQDQSVPAQRDAVAKYAESTGYHILREHVDDGVSGWKTHERAGFQQLLADLHRGDFRAILCWHPNRFSRCPPRQTNYYWHILDEAGVHLSSVCKGRLDWDSLGGWLQASIEQHADSEHRFKLAADVRRGMQAVSEKGLWQGTPPFGYVLGPDRRLAFGPEHEVAFIRNVFARYVAGESFRMIGARLAAAGVRNRNGAVWSASSLHALIGKPAYLGDVSRGEIYVRDAHPAIVDRETFDFAQRLRVERRPLSTPHLGGGGYLFTGLLRCGQCGESMCGRASSGHRIYHCNGFASRGAAFCDRNSVRQTELAREVGDAIAAWFARPSVAEQLRAELRRQIGEPGPESNPDRLRAQAQAAEMKLSKAKRRLLEVDRDMLPLVQEQIRELQRQLTASQTALEAARTPRSALLAAGEELLDRSLSMYASLPQTLLAADQDAVRATLRQWIERIDVKTAKRGEGHGARFTLLGGEIRLRPASYDAVQPSPLK